jgi:hypothetical protein
VAQQTTQDYLFFENGIGRTLKHRSYFNVQIVQPSYIAVLQYRKTPSGKAFWHKSYINPSINYSIIFANIGNNYTAGWAFGGMIGTTLHNKKNTFAYSINSGIAYLNKPFDIIHNYNNNVIGSTFNNVTQLKCSYQISKKSIYKIEPFFSFTHFSNGRFASPNQGYNIISIGLAGGFPIHKNKKNDSNISAFDSFQFSKKIIPSIQYAMAWGENLTPNGPKNITYVLGAFINKRITNNTSLFLNNECSYDAEENNFIKHAELGNINFKNGFRNSIFIGAEVFLGKISFKGKTGTDLIHAFHKRSFSISELSLNYYIKDAQIHQHNNLAFGINLQTILFNAQHLGLSCTYQF